MISPISKPGGKRRWLVGILVSIALVFLMLVLISGHLITRLGGAFAYRPKEMEAGLSKSARGLVDRAFAGMDPDRLLDYHSHLLGLGTHQTGCFVNPRMRTWIHPIDRFRFEVYLSAAGVSDTDQADQQFIHRLVSLVRAIPGHGRHVLLAFDRHHRPDGSVNLDKTEFYVPNEHAVRVAREHPDLFVPAVSLHPYRPDALAELSRWAQEGVRLVKWLPNAMGIDPSDPRCEPFYERMKQHGMILLTHTGEEKAVEAGKDQELGNPLLLRKPLDMGVQVIAAHSASLGRSQDTDSPGREISDSFDLFMRLMDEKKYQGLLFGEISAIVQYNRLPGPLLTLLARGDLHHRLVNGSDYPLPAVNFVVRTKDLQELGVITEDERVQLNEIYDYNPLLFDFVVKRTVRLPGTDQGFAPEVFMAHPDLLLKETGSGHADHPEDGLRIDPQP